MFFFGLFVCFALLCRGGAVSGLTVGSVSRTESQDGLQFTLTAVFTADQQPDAVWWTYTGHTQILSGSTLNYDPSTKQGDASLTINKSDFDIAQVRLDLGDLDTVFFELTWNTQGSGDRSQQLSLPSSSLPLGADLAYSPGNQVTVQFGVQINRGQGVTFYDQYVFLTGQYYDAAKGKVVSTEGGPFMQSSSSTSGGVTTTTVTFLTDKFTINGHFRGQLYATPDDTQTSPLSSVAENFRVIVHESSNSGPFPDDLTLAQMDGQVRCTWSCTVYCTTHGNDIDTVRMFKEENGSRTPMAITVDGTGYEQLAVLELDKYDPSTPGTYVCQVTQTGGVYQAESSTVVSIG